MSEITHDGVEVQSLRTFTESAYLNYSMRSEERRVGKECSVAWLWWGGGG